MHSATAQLEDPPPEAGHSPVSVDQALDAIRDGRAVVLADDRDRKGAGYIYIAAQFATPDAINFMAKHARGLVCLCLTSSRCDQLKLEPMTRHDPEVERTAFTVSVEARNGVTTGISVADRAHTIQVAIAENATARDLVVPGHVFPLRTLDGGVLKRAGHPEAAVDLARLAGLKPAGVICQVINQDGTAAGGDDLEAYSRIHDLPLVSIGELVAYRRRRERLIERGPEAVLPTRYGKFTGISFTETISGQTHIAMVKGPLDPDRALVRVHSECLTGDVLHSLRCDCGEQLEMAMQQIEAEGSGVVLYLSQEGRGIGLLNKLRAYELQEQGLDTVEANVRLGLPIDDREYGVGAQILADLGVRKIRILTNNPRKIAGLEAYGLEILEQVALEAEPNHVNQAYLAAKRDRLGHRLAKPPSATPD
jgi:3,4-dihydroxy 2-butanone 4-phosphate synthase / GTP cyclohydrolase II